MPAFSKVQRAHVLAALRRLDSGEPHPFGPHTEYLVTHGGKTYLPKAVVGWALEAATGEKQNPSTLLSGYGQAFTVLQRRGFQLLRRNQDNAESQWWAFTTGSEGEEWPRFLRDGYIAHLGGGLGDLRAFKSMQEIEEAMFRLNPGESRPTNGARGNWEWVHEVKEGDFVVAKRGTSTIQGVGRVMSDYTFESAGTDPYRHRRRVAWMWAGEVAIPPDEHFARKVLTNIGHRSALIGVAKELAGRSGFNFAPETPPRFVVGDKYTRADVRRLVGLPEARGGMWDTGYVKHEDAWYLFPNIGIAGRTGHNYGNAWEGDRLRWFAKTGTTLDQPEMQAMLSGDAEVHLFTRTADRDPFTYEGLVTPAEVVEASPVEVLWTLETTSPSSAHVPPLAEELDEGETFIEGARLQVVVNAYERNGAARRACIALHGTKCAVCDRLMEEVYGPEFVGLVHVHHLRSIADIGEEYEVDPEHDLRPVCPNCHAVVHWKTKVPLTIEQARAMLARQRPGPGPAGGPIAP